VDPVPSGRTPRAKGGCEWRLRHPGREPRRSGSASNRDRRRKPLKRAPAHAGARGNEPRMLTKGMPWAEPGRSARGPRLTVLHHNPSCSTCSVSCPSSAAVVSSPWRTSPCASSLLFYKRADGHVLRWQRRCHLEHWTRHLRRRSRQSTRSAARRIHGVRTLPNLRASLMAPAAVTVRSGTTGSPAARRAVTVQVLHVFSR
jgi:hypothetical protein